MAHHVADFDLAGRELVAADDGDERRAQLVGLLELALQRAPLVIGLGAQAGRAQLRAQREDLPAQLRPRVGDVDARRRDRVR